MYYKIVQVEEGLYIDNEGKNYEVFEGQTVKCPANMTPTECGWIEYDSIEQVLTDNKLQENTELINKLRGVFNEERK